MTFLVVGLNHRTAPIDVRERFMFDHNEVPAALARVLADDAVREAALLSTCNRTEFYFHLDDSEAGLREAVSVFADHAGELPQQLESYLYVRRGADAVRHLYRVASGLDSMVLGEVQIQGQVREAYEAARGLSGDRRAVRAIFNRLFQSALSVGGRVRTETHISEGAASVPSAAVDLATKIFGSLRGRSGMVLGTGEMGRLTARTLVDEGLDHLFVISRRRERAEQLAADMGGRAIPYPKLWDRLANVDILVTCSGAPHAVITREEVERATHRQKRRPLLIVDISVPRDVEAAVGDLPNVFLYSIDDLEQIVTANCARRQEEVPAAERIVDRAVDDFWRWHAGLRAVPIIKELRERAERVRQAELDRAIAQFSDLSPQDRERIDRLTRSMLHKLLHEPTTRLRKAAENGSDLDILAALRFLLGPGEHGEE